MKALTTKEEGFVVEIGGKSQHIWFKFVGVGGDQKAHMEGVGGVSCAFRRPRFECYIIVKFQCFTVFVLAHMQIWTNHSIMTTE